MKTLDKLLATTIDPLKVELERLISHEAEASQEHRQKRRKLEKDLAARLAKVESSHNADMKETRENIDRLRGVLKGLGLKDKDLPRVRVKASNGKPKKTAHPSGKIRKSPGGVATGFGISVESALKCVEVIKDLVKAREDAEEEPVFSTKEFNRAAKEKGVPGNAAEAIRYLREIEFIRRAGFDERGELYGLLDADAMDRVVEGIENNEAHQRERFLNASLDSTDQYERTAAFIRDNSPVEGWVTIVREAGVSDGRINHIGSRLRELHLIDVSVRRGGRATITWRGEES